MAEPSAWILGIGILVGLISAWSTWWLRLDSDELPALRVYAYDLWCPPLVTWFIVCLVESSLTILRCNSLALRVWVAMTTLAGLGIYAEQHPESYSKHLWQELGFVTRFTSMSLSAWLALKSFQRLHGPRRWLRLSVIFTPASLGSIHWPAVSRSGWRQIALLIALVGVAVSVASPFYFPGIDWPLAWVGFIFSWLLLAEIAAAGPLTVLVQSIDHRIRQRWAALPPVGVTRTAVRTRLSASAATIGGWMKATVNASSLPVALLKLFLGILLLIVLNEIPHVGKTIIQPFTTYTLDDQTAVPSDLGQAVADRLLHTLNGLQQNIQKEVIPLRPVAKKAGETFSITFASGPPGIDIALAKSGDPEIGNVKLPLRILLDPIQSRLRALLGARVIDGSVQINQFRYAILVRSTAGDVWKAEVENPTPNWITKVTDELAFKIMVNSPTFQVTGMTHSWDEFAPFRDGQEAWRRFESRQDYVALLSAIKYFRDATAKDTSFALAYYQLALALLADGQPAAAVAALRQSIHVSPHFGAGYIALAAALYDFEHYLRRTAAASSPSREPSLARRKKARQLWVQILQLPSTTISQLERAAGYFGLCRYAVDSGNSVGFNTRYSLAYFYCKRAEALYATLPAAQRATTSNQRDEGSVLYSLGWILENKARKRILENESQEPRDTTAWPCRDKSLSEYQLEEDENILDSLWRIGCTVQAVQVCQGEDENILDPLWRSPRVHGARRYYEMARVLLPDDPAIKYRIAALAYAAGDPKPMQSLANDTAARVYLADTLRKCAKRQDKANKAALYYRQALAEFERAREHDPTYIDALNNYGYTFWEWRVRWPRAKPPDGPDTDIAYKAELYARQAVALAVGKLGSEWEAPVRSTLGEVLLGQGRHEEAIEQLEQAVAITPQHPLYDEARWDLAQAYFCASMSAAAAESSSDEAVRAPREKAVPLLQEISHNDQTREDKLFAGNPDALDPARSWNVCNRPPEFSVERTSEPSGHQFDFEVNHEPYPLLCKWTGVVADVDDLKNMSCDDLRVHVWGGGVDYSIRPGETCCDNILHPGETCRNHIFLSFEPRQTHEYYFAQLRDSKGIPLSKASPFKTFANKGDDQCPQNLIKLTFKRISTAAREYLH